MHTEVMLPDDRSDQVDVPHGTSYAHAVTHLLLVWQRSSN
jgi:hypothetical protein